VVLFSSPVIFPSPQPQPGGFFLGFCRARRALTGERFNPTFFGTAGITSEPNRAHRCSRRLLKVKGNNNAHAEALVLESPQLSHNVP
jgi:hypothetical protein